MKRDLITCEILFPYVCHVLKDQPVRVKVMSLQAEYYSVQCQCISVSPVCPFSCCPVRSHHHCLCVSGGGSEVECLRMIVHSTNE